MGGIDKKILKIIRKNADSDLEADDIAMMARCDDDDVTMALDSLLAQDLIRKEAKPGGKTVWYPADAEAQPKAKKGKDAEAEEETRDVAEKVGLREKEVVDPPPGFEETRATSRSEVSLDDDDESILGEDDLLADDDEPVVRQNPITGFFMNLLNRSPKEDDDSADMPELPEEKPEKPEKPAKELPPKSPIGKVEKKILALLKKNPEDDLDAEDIALRAKIEEDEVAAALETLLSEGMVTKRMSPKNIAQWSAA